MENYDNEYDISKAFERIEDELIKSMIRNLERHRAEEEEYGFNWSQWQVEQLAALEKYKRYNSKKYGTVFEDLNRKVGKLINLQKLAGAAEQEVAILEAIRQGVDLQRTSEALAEDFFQVNERKLDALINAVTKDMEKAEVAILRMANDKYRKVIFDAQVYANTGAGTYEKAIDMATKDMLAAGLNCIEYKNGSRHRLEDYAEMAIRTAVKRAYLSGEGTKRQEWGIATVIVNKRGNPCHKCLPFCGKVLIDDVWSGGVAWKNGKQRNNNPNEVESKKGIDTSTGKTYPLMSYAIERGLYHPNCRDSHTTYFPGISTADDTWTKEELESIGLNAKQEARQQYAERQAKKYRRLAKYSLDKDNKREYSIKEKQWNSVANSAETDIIKNIRIPNEALEIEGFSQRVLEESQKAIDTLSNEYNILLDEIAIEALGNEQSKIPFQFQARKQGNYTKLVLVINKDYKFPSSVDVFNQNISMSKVAGNSISDLIVHELAHVMTYQDMPYSQVVNLEIPFVKGVSGYADSTYDGAESLAEAFVRYKNGEEVVEQVRELLDTYILKWRK